MHIFTKNYHLNGITCKVQELKIYKLMEKLSDLINNGNKCTNYKSMESYIMLTGGRGSTSTIILYRWC